MVERTLRTLNHLVYMDNYTGGNAGLFMKMSRLIYSYQSPYQRIDIFEHPDFGMVLSLDGVTILTEADEFMYHEMLVHVPMFVHPDPKKILILGGGNGGVLREVMKHDEVEEAVICEIDPFVIEASRKYLKTIATEFDNPRVKVFNDNGADFVKKYKDYFDVIIVDSTDPTEGEGGHLFTREFYGDCCEALSENGVFSAETEDPFYDRGWVAIASSRISAAFPVSKVYTGFVTTHPSGMWTYNYASKNLNPLDDFDAERVREFPAFLKYYNEDIHRAAFALPNFLADIVNQA